MVHLAWLVSGQHVGRISDPVGCMRLGQQSTTGASLLSIGASMVSPGIHFSWHSLVSVQCHLGLYSELSGRHRAVPLTQIGLSCWIVPILR